MSARGTFRGGARGRGRGRGRGGRGGNSSSDLTNWRDETSSNQSNGESGPTALVSLAEMSIANAKKKRKERVFVHPTEMVTFIVGEDDNVQKFSVHKEFACRNSPVLDRAFNSEFIEGQTHTYTLEDNTPAAFRLFVQFLYQEKITLDCHNEDPSNDLDYGRNSDEHAPKCFKQEQDLVQLWILAEKFLIPKLQDQILDHLYRSRLACGPVLRPICRLQQHRTW